MPCVEYMFMQFHTLELFCLSINWCYFQRILIYKPNVHLKTNILIFSPFLILYWYSILKVRPVLFFPKQQKIPEYLAGSVKMFCFWPCVLFLKSQSRIHNHFRWPSPNLPLTSQIYSHVTLRPPPLPPQIHPLLTAVLICFAISFMLV